MRGKLFLHAVLMLSLGLGAGVSAAAEKTATQPAAAKAGKAKKTKKADKAHLRLTLMPPLCVEQFVDTTLNLHRPPPSSAAADNGGSLPAGATSPRLGLQTDWGVAPFVGSALPLPAETPERIPADGGTMSAGTAPFCDLDAGVSYSLGRSTNLNLGYRLPSSVWSGALGPLGEDGAGESSGKQVTIGIDIGF
jgi:hypothetical protein